MENQNPWDTDNNSANFSESSPIEARANTSTLAESDSIINTQRYASLTGFTATTNHLDESETNKIEDAENTESTLFEADNSSNPYQSRTFHSFSSHPIPKIILVFGSVLVAVLIAGIILNSGSFKQAARKENIEPVPSNHTSLEPQESDPPELDKGELLTEIALSEQKQQLKALDEPKTQPSPPPPNPKPNPAVSPAPSTKIVYRTVTAPTPTSVSSITPIKPIEPPIAPQQAWIAATKIGNYGQVTSLSTSEGQNNLALDKTTPLENKSNTSNSNNRERLTQKTQTSTPQILIGSKAKAVLTNSVVWDNSNIEQRELFFRLEEPLNSNDSSERSVSIPQGSQIIASINEVSPSGVIHLKIHSVLLEEQGNYQQLPLPADSLYIQGKKGKPLLAKSFSPNNSPDWGGLATEAVGTAAIEADLPGGRNLPRVIDRLSPSRSRYSRASSYWSLKENTEVEILVARSFVLPLASKEKQSSE